MLSGSGESEGVPVGMRQWKTSSSPYPYHCIANSHSQPMHCAHAFHGNIFAL